MPKNQKGIDSIAGTPFKDLYRRPSRFVDSQVSYEGEVLHTEYDEDEDLYSVAISVVREYEADALLVWQSDIDFVPLDEDTIRFVGTVMGRSVWASGPVVLIRVNKVDLASEWE